MYQVMFYVGLGLTIFFTLLSVIIFIRNNVGKMLGEITGWNVKMATRQRKKYVKPFVQRESLPLLKDGNTEYLKNEEPEEIFFGMIEDIMVVHTK